MKPDEFTSKITSATAAFACADSLMHKTLADVRAALDRYEREVLPTIPESDRTFEADGVTVRNLWRIEQHDEFFKDLAFGRRFFEIVSALVHGEAVLMGVETFNKPARVGSGVPPHQDNAYFCRTPAGCADHLGRARRRHRSERPDLLFEAQPHARHPAAPTVGRGGQFDGAREDAAARRQRRLSRYARAGRCADSSLRDDSLEHTNKTDFPRCGFLMVFRGAHAVRSRAQSRLRRRPR